MLLASWSLVQPTVRPFTNSMQAEDILLWTAAKIEKPLGYREYREYHKSSMEKDPQSTRREA